MAQLEQLTTKQHLLRSAINSIRNTYQSYVTRLEELKNSLPPLLAATTLGEADGTELESVRHEIHRLQCLIEEPYLEAITIIKNRLQPITQQVNTHLRNDDTIQRERYFRELFNHFMETSSHSSYDWEKLQAASSLWHRRDIESLDQLLHDYENQGLHYLPGSPSFVDFASTHGLRPYNLDVTMENITNPRPEQVEITK